MTNAELVQTYVDLLIIEYSDPNNQPKALATIGLLANEAIANQVVSQVGAGFALTNIYGQTVAQGVQLNTMGQFVGAERFLPGYPPSSTVFFGMQDTTGSYSATIGGLDDVFTGSVSGGFWNSPNQITGTYVLNDAQMILLIQYLATVNNAYLSVSEVDEILFNFFGIYVTVAESATMQITYTESLSDPGTLYGIVKYLGALPHPAGVKVIS